MLPRLAITMFTKKTILHKMMEVSGATLLSRCLGVVREILLVRYLGVSAVSDAFINAYKIPNSLRKIFAEGALSAAFIPTIVTTMRTEGKQSVAQLMSLGFLFFEGIVVLLCGLAMWQAPLVMGVIAPGFSAEQIAYAVSCLRIIMPFIFFVSSSALLAGALQSVGHFFVPAIAPVLLNVVFIVALLICNAWGLPVEALCWFIVLGGLLQFVLHLVMYRMLQFGFSLPNKKNLRRFIGMLGKFFLCLPSAGMLELQLVIDTSFASLLAKGSTTLLYYGNRFMGIPLGVFAVALSTILLPHFSRVAVAHPKRLGFYILESAKFVLWVTLPISIGMAFFAEDIFYTIFASNKFSAAHVQEAATILRIFLCGLFFFSINKILMNVYYALHNTWLPAVVTAGATVSNIVLNYLFIGWWQASGLALATVLSSMLQTGAFILLLHSRFAITFPGLRFVSFIQVYTVQLVVLLTPLLCCYYIICYAITQYLSVSVAYLLLQTILLWVWVGALAGIAVLFAWRLRKLFGRQIYFID